MGVPWGGKYRWKKNPDGTFDMYDVPIFGELPPGERHNKKHVGRSWHEAAIEKAKARRDKDGYVAPLHVKHHVLFGSDTKRAGFLMPTAAKERELGGKKQSVLHADLLYMPSDVFSRIEKVDLPYRSVEVADWDDPEILSLALLDDEAPYFKFELTTKGEEIKDTPARMDGPLAVAAFSHQGRSHILMKFADEKGEGAPSHAQSSSNPASPSADAHSSAPKQDGHRDAEMAVLSELKAMLQSVVEAIGRLAPQPPPPPQPAMPKPAELPKGQASDQKKSFKQENTMTADELKAVEAAAEACAAKDALAAKENADAQAAALKGLVDDAHAALAEYAVSESSKKELSTIAERGGKEAVDAFVSAFKKIAPKMPPKSAAHLDKLMASAVKGSAAPNDPAEIAKYADRPDGLARARQFADAWKRAKDRRMTDLSLERWLAVQFAMVGTLTQ
jgi:hypothetical protein